MKSIEEMSKDELKEIIYALYSTLESAIEEEAAFNRDNALDLLISALDHAQEDHEAAKIAILCYGNLTLQLGKEVKLLTLENMNLTRRLG